jgi:hypothetical protein
MAAAVSSSSAPSATLFEFGSSRRCRAGHDQQRRQLGETLAQALDDQQRRRISPMDVFAQHEQRGVAGHRRQQIDQQRDRALAHALGAFLGGVLVDRGDFEDRAQVAQALGMSASSSSLRFATRWRGVTVRRQSCAVCRAGISTLTG